MLYGGIANGHRVKFWKLQVACYSSGRELGLELIHSFQTATITSQRLEVRRSQNLGGLRLMLMLRFSRTGALLGLAGLFVIHQVPSYLNMVQFIRCNYILIWQRLWGSERSCLGLKGLIYPKWW